MTTTYDEPEQPTIPTTTVEVEGLGTIGEDQLPDLTKAWLEKVIRALDGVPPKRASRDDLELVARNGLRLRAMMIAELPVAAIEAPDAPPDPSGDETGAEVALTADDVRPLVAPSTTFEQIVKMADYLARSNLCPKALRGKPNDVGAVLLRAWDLGISQSAALESLYVIDGRVGMEGKLMAALIRRAGHSLRVVESDGFHARWYGCRSDNGDEAWGEFSLAEAKQAGLIESFDNETGAVRAKQGKDSWRNYTKAMLKWRALAVLARDLFSDCIAGVSYLAEELGYIDAEPADQVGAGTAGASAEEPTVTANQARDALAARIAQLPDDLRKELAEEWTKRGFPRVADLRPAAIGQAQRIVSDLEKRAQERYEAEQEAAGVTDAEIVSESDPEQPETAAETTAGGTGPPEAETAAESPEDAEIVEFCAGCGERIADDVNPVYDNEEKPYHPECSPFETAP